MELLHCLVCGDARRLVADVVIRCRCARCFGYLDESGAASVHGPCRVVRTTDASGGSDGPQGWWYALTDGVEVRRLPGAAVA